MNQTKHPVPPRPRPAGHCPWCCPVGPAQEDAAPSGPTSSPPQRSPSAEAPSAPRPLLALPPKPGNASSAPRGKCASRTWCMGVGQRGAFSSRPLTRDATARVGSTRAHRGRGPGRLLRNGPEEAGVRGLGCGSPAPPSPQNTHFPVEGTSSIRAHGHCLKEELLSGAHTNSAPSIPKRENPSGLTWRGSHGRFLSPSATVHRLPFPEA